MNTETTLKQIKTSLFVLESNLNNKRMSLRSIQRINNYLKHLKTSL